jgi:hypothetical protein
MAPFEKIRNRISRPSVALSKLHFLLAFAVPSCRFPMFAGTARAATGGGVTDAQSRVRLVFMLTRPMQADCQEIARRKRIKAAKRSSIRE